MASQLKIGKLFLLIIMFLMLVNCDSPDRNYQNLEIFKDTFKNGSMKTEGELLLGKSINEWSYYNYDSSLYRIVIFLDNGKEKERSYILQDFENNQLVLMEKYLNDTLFYRKIYSDSLYSLYNQSIINMNDEAKRIKQEEIMNGIEQEQGIPPQNPTD